MDKSPAFLMVNVLPARLAIEASESVYDTGSPELDSPDSSNGKSPTERFGNSANVMFCEALSTDM